MRLHQHQVGGTNRWHSVRAHHDDAWDWCAHHEEIERHPCIRRGAHDRIQVGEQLELEAAH
jgi:hypothetical protein